jgi:hypothetical protein
MTMHGPPLVAWLIVALNAAAAISCLLRGRERVEALTGAAMAAMAVPLSVADPWAWGGPALAAVFGAAALYVVLGPGRHTAHRTHHAVCSAAMAYMAVAMSGMAAGDGHGGHGGHGGTGVPLLTGALLVYFAAYVVRAGVRLVMVPAVAAGAPGGVRPPLRRSPEVADACRISMALGMLAMLVTL